MGDVPYPLTADNIDDLKTQIFEILRKLYEEKIGGCDLGDVFSIVGNVFTLALASASGLTKEGKLLSIDVTSTGGLQLSTSGISVMINTTGGLETTASGVGIKLDGDTLALSSSGVRVNPLLLNIGTTLIDNTDSPYYALVTDSVIYVNTDGGAIQVNLIEGSDGKKCKVINCGGSGNNITLVPDATDLLFGVNESQTIYDGEIFDLDFNTTKGWW
jgi:hypothetical protein